MSHGLPGSAAVLVRPYNKAAGHLFSYNSAASPFVVRPHGTAALPGPVPPSKNPLHTASCRQNSNTPSGNILEQPPRKLLQTPPPRLPFVIRPRRRIKNVS